MPTAHVAQALRPIVVLGKEQSRVGAVDGVFAEQVVDALQQALQVIHRQSALTAQIGLQVRHQQCPRNALSGYVAQHESESFLPQVEEVVVVSANLASLNAHSGVVESAQWRQRLR